jgi:hypothetical protein
MGASVYQCNGNGSKGCAREYRRRARGSRVSRVNVFSLLEIRVSCRVM